MIYRTLLEYAESVDDPELPVNILEYYHAVRHFYEVRIGKKAADCIGMYFVTDDDGENGDWRIMGNDNTPSDIYGRMKELAGDLEDYLDTVYGDNSD